jgi:hypothetical protein
MCSGSDLSSTIDQELGKRKAQNVMPAMPASQSANAERVCTTLAHERGGEGEGEGEGQTPES